VDHDQHFKELLQTFLPEFVALFLPAEAAQIDWSSVEFLDKELFTDLLQGVRRSVDLVARVRTTAGDPELLLVHVEVEAAPRSDFPQRMYEYHSLLRLRYRLPVLPIAVFLRPASSSTGGSYEEYVFGLRTIRFEYPLFVLPNIALGSLAVENPVTHALAPLVSGHPVDPVELTLDSLAGIARTVQDPARQELLGSFLSAYVDLNSRQQAELARRLTDNENQEVRLMMTIWRREGLEEGLEVGKAEGRLDGMRESIRYVLDARLGVVPSRVLNALEVVTDATALARLSAAAASATSYADFEAALTRYRE
jgi:hypothetical protein